MDPSDLDVALAAARAGAELLRPLVGLEQRTELKGAVDPVTEADRRAEESILGVIRSRRPADHVLAEETGGSGWDRGRVWIVDPLDGTVNFVHRIPHIAVSVALYADGAPLVGVVVDVTRGEVFSATAGMGASCDGAPLAVTEVSDPASALVATGFPYDRQQRAEAYAAVMAAVLARFQGIRRFGSAALDICWVAAGRYDGYWEYALGPWDSAAAVLIAREAGARVSRTDGAPHRIDDGSIVVAGPNIHEQLRSTVRRREEAW